jgi:hypothetical protein
VGLLLVQTATQLAYVAASFAVALFIVIRTPASTLPRLVLRVLPLPIHASPGGDHPLHPLGTAG